MVSPQLPEAMEVIESVCRDRGAGMIRAGHHLSWRPGARGPDGQELEVHGRLGVYQVWIPLLGDFQLENAATAVGVLEVLKEQGSEISASAIAEGLRRVSWPCRMEVLGRSPLVVCDGAHNPHSAARLRETLPDYFDYRRLILVVGVSREKNMEGIVGELASLADTVIVTCSRHPRAASTDLVGRAFSRQGLNPARSEGVDEAVKKALEEAGESDLVLVTGSLFVAAEAREALLGIVPELYPELEPGPGPLHRR